MNRKSQNLQHHLWARESNLYFGLRHPIPSHFLFHEKSFYKSITPRMTVQNVDKPLGYIRKFSPNGKHLIVYSNDRKSLDVYRYLGVGNVYGLLHKVANECITAADQSLLSVHIRKSLFDYLLQKEYSIPIITDPSSTRIYLYREFGLFLDRGNYLLTASIAGGCIFPSIGAYPEYPDLLDDTELYNTTFYIIDLRLGRITDTIRMPHDYIHLADNHSVYILEPTVAILSTYRQCIELFNFDRASGKLHRTHILGPFLNSMDRDRVLEHHRDVNFVIDPHHSLPFAHLKQKILAHMYNEIMDSKTPQERRIRLRAFYKSFPLVITKH